jgi:hypothetical protein
LSVFSAFDHCDDRAVRKGGVPPDAMILKISRGRPNMNKNPIVPMMLKKAVKMLVKTF